MDILVYSYVFGPLILIALYCLCFFLVVGIKVCIYFIKPDKIEPKKVESSTVKPPVKRKPKTVKCIEIDPDYIDKIYVKKSS